MSLKVLEGSKKITDTIVVVRQGEEESVITLNAMLKNDWIISEMLALSGSQTLPGEVIFVLTRGF
jgi:hypothetical protein